MTQDQIFLTCLSIIPILFVTLFGAAFVASLELNLAKYLPSRNTFAQTLLLCAYAVAMTWPGTYCTVCPSVPFEHGFCGIINPDAEKLNQLIVNRNLDLLIGWPMACTAIFTALTAWLFRNTKETF